MATSPNTDVATPRGQVPPDRIDPDVAVPSAVREQAARIEAMYAQTGEEQGQEGENQPQDQDEQGENQPDGQQTVPQEAVPVAPTVVQEAPAPQQPPKKQQEAQPVSPQPDDQSWENRYKAMKGRYDRADERIRQLEDLLATLNTRQQAHTSQNTPQNTPSPAPKNPDLAFEGLITPQHRETYGDEFVDFAERVAKQAIGPYIQELQSKIAQIDGRVQGVGQTVERDSKQKMYQTLDAELPNWRDMDSNPEFIKWLKFSDVLSGEQRYNLLQRALDAHDAHRVLQFFRSFLAEEAALAPVSVSPPQATAQPAAPRVDMRQYAAPGRARSAAGTPPAEKHVYTEAQIGEFFSACRRGEYRGRDEEKKRIEADIFRAQQEGRIR